MASLIEQRRGALEPFDSATALVEEFLPPFQAAFIGPFALGSALVTKMLRFMSLLVVTRPPLCKRGVEGGAIYRSRGKNKVVSSVY